MPLTAYVASRIWGPIGAEATASWTIDAKGHEVAYCCFNAVLRDWGRLGALLANDGAWEGQQLIPRPFLLDATTPQAPFLTPGVNGRRLGYGYQTWLLPGDRRQFALRGIYGQTMLIDPLTRTVLVHTAARPSARDSAGEAELTALWNALVAQRTP
jgi:CubicO group peptidase (beta-lactamase class C family)